MSDVVWGCTFRHNRNLPVIILRRFQNSEPVSLFSLRLIVELGWFSAGMIVGMVPTGIVSTGPLEFPLWGLEAVATGCGDLSTPIIRIHPKNQSFQPLDWSD